MIITISDMWKNQQKMLDNDNQIKLSSLIVFLGSDIRIIMRNQHVVDLDMHIWDTNTHVTRS